MKTAFIAALIALIPICASAGQASRTPENIPVIALDKSPPGIFYASPFAVWNLNEDWQVNARHVCTHDKLLDWWPQEPKCEGRLWVELNTRDPNGELSSEKMRLKERWEFGGGPERTLSVDGKTGTEAELFELLLKLERPVLGVNDFKVELEDFAKLSDKSLKSKRQQEDEEVAKKREEIFLNVIVLLALLVAIAFALRWAVRKAPAVASAVAEGVAKGVRTATDEVEKMHVRRVTRDEVIRQTAREALAEASESEKEALRHQIKQALDSGNHELAGTLKSVLKKLENA